MIRYFIFILLYFIFFVTSAQANIDVVYPTSKEVTINASSTFFVGNTDSGAAFYINSEPVKLWNNNFFVKVVPLDYGKNKIKLKSVINGKVDEVVYQIKRNRPSSGKAKEIPFQPKVDDTVVYTKIIKENATVREKATKASKRVVDLPINVILYLEGKKGDYYKIEENGNSEYWIHESNVQPPVRLSKKMKAKFKKQKFYSDELYDYHKFYLSHPVMYSTKHIGDKVLLTLYGVETEANINSTIQNFEYTFEFDTQVIGYDCYYEDNTFVFKSMKLPEEIDEVNPLKNITIFIDAGHGGSEKGAVGPTRVNEKDINLSITNYLVELLKATGANVITSRTNDVKVSLVDRVSMAKNNNALISISIHNNSLPNGKDPYEKHGCEVHYYNENAKLLAEIINTNLALDLNLKDGGIHKSSFAMNRSTSPVSVLVEVAYMINPQEYMLLQNSQFQKNAAKSIKKSLEKYILMIKK